MKSISSNVNKETIYEYMFEIILNEDGQTVGRSKWLLHNRIKVSTRLCDHGATSQSMHASTVRLEDI